MTEPIFKSENDLTDEQWNAMMDRATERAVIQVIFVPLGILSAFAIVTMVFYWMFT